MGETMEITSYVDIDFPEFSGPPGCLLESDVDFDDLFVGIQFFDGDMLPELEMDPDLLAELSSADLEEDSATSPDCSNKACVSDGADDNQSTVSVSNLETEKEEEKVKSRHSITNSPAKDREKMKKSPSSQAKNNNNNPGKRKTKVDWTPDLHRKFVKAVEQLGVDKAVPSRILELMGIRRLTRHNIASHLQKYRSHRKHLLEREAGAASWSLQKRQLHGAIGVGPPGGKVKVHAVPTMGFPPAVAPPPHHHHAFQVQHLHVWGHPTGHHLEHQPMMHGWPKHLAPSPSPLLHYPPSPRVASFWHSHHQHRFTPPPVQGFPPPPHAIMYKPEHGVATSATTQSSSNHPPSDSHPTKESIDDVIGDVLSKPWLPLPIGLKPPSMDIVMEELQRQGLPSILLPSDSS